MRKDVGLHMISFGLEHGNEQFRRDVVKRPYPNSVAIEAFKTVKKSGVHFSVNNIIGFPGETRELEIDLPPFLRKSSSFARNRVTSRLNGL